MDYYIMNYHSTTHLWCKS